MLNLFSTKKVEGSFFLQLGENKNISAYSESSVLIKIKSRFFTLYDNVEEPCNLAKNYAV